MKTEFFFDKAQNHLRGRSKSLQIVGFFTIFFFNSLHAQNQYLTDVNLELRHMFSQISFPDNNVKFLYERSAKMSDSVFYQNNCPDTSNMSTWNLLYEEMFYAAHDTSWMQSVYNVTTYPHQFAGDTIVMGIMDYDFYHVLPQALSTGNYFTFDIPGNKIFDHPNPAGTPYGRLNIFSAAALKEVSYFSNPVFRIDPNQFFSDNISASFYNLPHSLRIDFGDGTGWHYFNINQLSHYEAEYSTNGKKMITVQLYDSSRDLVLKSSICTVMVLKSDKSIPANEYFDLPGLTVGAYYPCENVDLLERKVIIYLEGYDPLDIVPAFGNTIEMNYEKMIHSKYIEELRNFNYAFYVVNYDQSALDMRINAMHVLNLIEFLKLEYAYSDEQFVLIGHSMGGIIGRFLLTYMETDEYQNGDFSPFSVELNDPQSLLYLNSLSQNGIHFSDIGSMNRRKVLVGQMHKVRTFITLDSPHQGASIPLGLQQFYKKGVAALPAAAIAAYYFNILLDSKASKQLLINHIDATPGAYLPNQNLQYMSHPHRASFMNQLAAMGDYPQFCKKIAYSSADMSGLNQKPFYDEDIFRTPNDPIADINYHLYARILWIPVSISSFQFRIKTNPSGNGEIFHASVGRYFNLPKFHWFGVTVTSTYVPFLQDTQRAINAKPYCTSAAGVYAVGTELVSQNNQHTQIDLTLNIFSFSFNASTNNGCFNLQSHIGLFSSGFLSSNVNFSLCTNGTSFGFVPLQSALDYGKGLNLPLNHNIQAENINTKLSRTPFDVIIGYTDQKNHNHSNEYYDPLIFNLTGQAATNCDANDPTGDLNYRFAYYDADQQSECEVKRSLMCLEIGDEEMYLENWTLNRNATFSAQYNMFVNERNPYYEYPSQASQFINYNGTYSKEASFLIDPNGYSSFLYGSLGNPTNMGFVYANDVSNYWEKEDREMAICVNNFAAGKSYLVEQMESVSEDQAHIRLYPNPNNGENLILEYDFKNSDVVGLEIFDLSGKKVNSLLDLMGGENKISLSMHAFEHGMYLVRVFTATESKTVRLIIN